MRGPRAHQSRAAELRLTRPFMLPTAMAAAEPPPVSASRDPDAPPAPVAPSRIYGAASPRNVLTPGVEPFLDGLADMHPPSADVEAVLEKARGQLRRAGSAAGQR
jgi:hypothetical protein